MILLSRSYHIHNNNWDCGVSKLALKVSAIRCYRWTVRSPKQSALQVFPEWLISRFGVIWLLIYLLYGPQLKAAFPTNAGQGEKKTLLKKLRISNVQKMVGHPSLEGSNICIWKNLRCQFIPQRARGMKEGNNCITFTSRVNFGDTILGMVWFGLWVPHSNLN